MYDPATKVGRSNALLDGSAADTNGVQVGTAGTMVSENMLSAPPRVPMPGSYRTAHPAQTRAKSIPKFAHLKMVNLGGPQPVVRAGLWYDNANIQQPPSRVSPGEVESHSGPNGAPANDLPASSFFDIFVQVDIPACGGFPGATVYNTGAVDREKSKPHRASSSRGISARHQHRCPDSFPECQSREMERR